LSFSPRIAIAEEVGIVFNTITVPPLILDEEVDGRAFDTETAYRLDRSRTRECPGDKPARIVAKMNSLVDQEIIEKL